MSRTEARIEAKITAREVALQALYQFDINNSFQSLNNETIRQSIDNIYSEVKLAKTIDCEYAAFLIKGVIENKKQIDSFLQAVSNDWKISRMTIIDRNILRIAVFEINWNKKDITLNIAINEAVELAKKFGTDDSARFVNGILGAVVKA